MGGETDNVPLGAALTCPSAPPVPGNVVLGVFSADAELHYIQPNAPVTDDLLQSIAAAGVAVENRLRVAGPCFGQECRQWNDGACGLVGRVLDALRPDPAPGGVLPKCGIRATCRWFAQTGRIACQVCPKVIREPGDAAPDADRP